MVKEGIIKVGYIWSPAEAGKAIVTVAKMVLDGKEITDGMEIPGLGKVSVDPDTRVIRAFKVLAIDKNTVDELVGTRTLDSITSFIVASARMGAAQAAMISTSANSDQTAQQGAPDFIEMRGISKRFGGVRAL